MSTRRLSRVAYCFAPPSGCWMMLIGCPMRIFPVASVGATKPSSSSCTPSTALPATATSAKSSLSWLTNKRSGSSAKIVPRPIPRSPSSCRKFAPAPLAEALSGKTCQLVSSRPGWTRKPVANPSASIPGSQLPIMRATGRPALRAASLGAARMKSSVGPIFLSIASGKSPRSRRSAASPRMSRRARNRSRFRSVSAAPGPNADSDAVAKSRSARCFCQRALAASLTRRRRAIRLSVRTIV